jgi:hypothetical protein
VVELHLAKVDVAGSSPVSRSLELEAIRLTAVRIAFFLFLTAGGEASA